MRSLARAAVTLALAVPAGMFAWMLATFPGITVPGSVHGWVLANAIVTRLQDLMLMIAWFAATLAVAIAVAARRLAGRS